jgi:hypothetical protein
MSAFLYKPVSQQASREGLHRHLGDFARGVYMDTSEKVFYTNPILQVDFWVLFWYSNRHLESDLPASGGSDMRALVEFYTQERPRDGYGIVVEDASSPYDAVQKAKRNKAFSLAFNADERELVRYKIDELPNRQTGS